MRSSRIYASQDAPKSLCSYNLYGKYLFGKASPPMTGHNTATVLELCDLHHSYGAMPAVRGVDLSIERGEVVCLLGPSGCGKTTSLRIAAGLEIPQKGEVKINGQVVTGKGIAVPPEQRHTGLVFQDYALFPHMTNADNIAFGLKALTSAQKKARIKEVLALVGMEDQGKKYPHMLSGGQQQRIALARALAPKPNIILMDEPFSGLDARLRERVREETLAILKDAGTAVLMVTHDPEEAMFMGDRIAIMNQGRIAQLASPQHMYLSPASAFVTEFLGEVNHLRGQVQQGQVATALGTFPAQQPDGTPLPEGQEVSLLLRPEAFQLQPLVGAGPESLDATATILSARLLGGNSLLRFSLAGPQGAKGLGRMRYGCDQASLSARVPWVILPEQGSQWRVSVDQSLVNIFPAADCPSEPLLAAAE